MPKLLAAPDKFRGTLDAAAVARAMAVAAEALGWTATALPLADGGEGTLEVLGGPNRTTRVTGPLGDPVRAGWRLDGDRAIIEMARASGLQLCGRKDPMHADTLGTGELIAAALDAGAKHIVVGVGGSASTDGGRGALQALLGRDFSGVDLQVAYDVNSAFLDAAREFGAQKGASPAQIEDLSAQLEETAEEYLLTFAIDVRTLPGSGAAGGLAGGLACLGARLIPGFDWIGERRGLDAALADADAVLTGEGCLDAGSFRGKVVAGVVERARRRGLPAAVICGQCTSDPPTADMEVISLVERCGTQAAMHDTAACIGAATAAWLRALDTP